MSCFTSNGKYVTQQIFCIVITFDEITKINFTFKNYSPYT